MKLRPLADNILLKATETEETTSSGIILATTNKEQSGIFEVTVSVGDKVVVGKYAGSEFKLDGEDYKFVKQEEILAVVTA